MRKLLSNIRQALATGQPAAWCRLVETRGSTPQKAGAAMLVHAAGGQAGTLGGGCVEAEVRRRAILALGEGRPELADFNLDNDYGWDDGLVCGGRMRVLIDPLGEQHVAYIAALGDLLESNRAGTEAILMADASYAVLLFDDHDQLLAQVRGAADQQQLATAAVARRQAELDAQGGARRKPCVQLNAALLPIAAQQRLVIVGAGHVGQAVAALAAELDFSVWVIDDRAEYASAERFPNASRLLVGDLEQLLPTLDITSSTLCLIVTRGHNHDERALYHLADRGAAYVGMIGSRRKIRLIFDDLEAAGLSRQALLRVHAPVGFEIGSQTVPEIAVSIAAQLVAARNGKLATR